MEVTIKNYRKPRVRKEVRKFAFFPIIHQGSLFWLSKVKIEKSFNGFGMQTINIQKL